MSRISPAPVVPRPLWADASLEELMALAGQKYALEFDRISAGGVELDILQIANMRELLDRAIAENALRDAVHTLPLWAKIWPASIILGHMLRHVPPQGHTVLEIGAGCGVTGLVAAALGFKRVCITDINEDALLFARVNILKNGLADRAEVRRADIQSDSLGERFSLILGSEILYLEHLYRPLVKFLGRHLLPKGAQPEPEAFLATDHRRSARPFFKRAEKEFQISGRQVGARQEMPAGTEEANSAEHGERHLLTVHRLRPLR